MAYKRYFYRNGRKFGPYYYESYRDKNGKIKKRYIGTKNLDKKTEKTEDFDDEIDKIRWENREKSTKDVTPTDFNLKILIFLLILLILTDFLFVLFYFK